jgi:RNA polymerase sigma factor (sigma-70 family)
MGGRWGATMGGFVELVQVGRPRPQTDAARKRAAVELVAGHEATLKRTARRYSLDEEDAEDALQRALEIVLTKAPTTDPRELIRWTQTVTKHEALAVREARERILGRRLAGVGAGFDPVALIPATSDGPDEQTERRESVARSREAMRALKPAELRALTLLAQGYSYAEIGELTGFSRTKINRSLAEGRERFRRMTTSCEDGTRCKELRPLLSAFCDGEVSAAEEETVREHLRACAGCRATMRAYRAAPRIAAGLVPALPPGRSLLGRLHDLFGGLSSPLPSIGRGGGGGVRAATSGGPGGPGIAGAAKRLGLCAAVAGGAACVATGVVPTPLDLSAPHRVRPTIERSVVRSPKGTAPKPAPAEAPPGPSRRPEKPQTPAEAPPVETAPAETEAPPSGATEYEAPSPAPEPVPAPSPSPSSESAAGEFGP